MKQEINKPFWKVLNEQRTQGELYTRASSMYENVIELKQNSNVFGQICPFNFGNKTSKEQNMINAQYAALAVNNFAAIVEALETLLEFTDKKQVGYKAAKEALNRIK